MNAVMSDAGLLLNLLHATARRAVAKISTTNPQTPCPEAHVTTLPPFGGSIAIEVQIDAFIPSAWPLFAQLSFVSLWRKRGSQILQVGQPPFWRRILGLFQKYRLIIRVQNKAGVSTSHVCIRQGNDAPVDLAESDFIV